MGKCVQFLEICEILSHNCFKKNEEFAEMILEMPLNIFPQI